MISALCSSGQTGPDCQISVKLIAMNVVLGISGGIAAYKTPELVRRLRERGAEVQIVMTASAGEFVTETALQAVSGRPIRSNLWDKEAEASMSHIELARWADVVLIAPATAEIMARLASGAASDLLTTVCLATEAPMAIAPAMNKVMWANAAVQSNKETLAARGVKILGPDSGSQACGEIGEGRMLDPDDIAAIVCGPALVRQENLLLTGKTIVMTAGPTREPIDPVRFITNRSSGKMGYALAEAALEQGARVVLISGPTSIAAPRGADIHQVETAQEMYDATHALISEADIFIGTAAVSDYRPVTVQPQKIKKNDETMTIELVKSEDILASVAAKDAAPFTVGFAAETEDLRANAIGKLERKNLHMIVANEVGEGKGFDNDQNAVTVFWKSGEQALELADKTELARDILKLIAERFEIAYSSGEYAIN